VAAINWNWPFSASSNNSVKYTSAIKFRKLLG